MNKENEYARRLHFISEDVKRLSDVLTEEILNTPVPNYENIGVVLSNIEIASNLNDDESSNWKTKFQIPTHDPQTGELNPFYEELTGKKNPLVNTDLIIKTEPIIIREDFKKDKDMDKMPNQKWHQIISFIKSGVRIVGYCFIPFNLVVATILLVLSEVIGVVEELV
jgi:hypothetical protein